MRILLGKIENFQMKNSGSFHISALNIDYGYSLEPPLRGGSNEYPRSMFLSRNKKIGVYPCKPQFYCIKMVMKGSELYRPVFIMLLHMKVITIPYNRYYRIPGRKDIVERFTLLLTSHGRTFSLLGVLF